MDGQTVGESYVYERCRGKRANQCTKNELHTGLQNDENGALQEADAQKGVNEGT